MDLSTRNKQAQRNPPTADAIFHVSCTLDNSKFSSGRGKGEINNVKHDAENMPGFGAY